MRKGDGGEADSEGTGTTEKSGPATVDRALANSTRDDVLQVAAPSPGGNPSAAAKTKPKSTAPKHECVPFLMAGCTLVILWAAAGALVWISRNGSRYLPLAVIATVGLFGLGLALAYEMVRLRDPWFETRLEDKLEREGAEAHKGAIVELYLRAGRLKRGALMAFGGAVVAIILFTMLVYGLQPEPEKIDASVVIASRIGGAILLMGIVYAIMASHAYALRLAAHFESVADLLRIDSKEQAARLLLSPPKYVMFRHADTQAKKEDHSALPVSANGELTVGTDPTEQA